MEVDGVLLDAIRGTFGLLVDGEYEALANMTHRQRMSEDEIRRAVEEYGRTLVWPPDGDLPSAIEFFEVEGSDPRQVRADVPLWTFEEGQSDLFLLLILTQNRLGLWGVQIDDIHVM